MAPAHTGAIDVGVGTYFPVSVTAEATLELPYRILVQGDLGWMPSPYSNAIIDVIGDLGAITSTEENLIKLAIKNSLVTRVAAGWRPFPKLGLELLVGYTLVAVGGDVSGSDVITAYLESRGSTERVPADASRSVPLSSTLHNIQATVGWRFLLLGDKLVLRTSLSYLQCLASSTGVDLAGGRAVEQAAIAKINTQIEGTLDSYYKEYVKVPVLGVTLAYRF